MPDLRRRVSGFAAFAVATGVVIAVTGAAVLLRGRDLKAIGEADAPGLPAPIHVPLWIDPNLVRPQARFRFYYDPPETLAALRVEERLDQVAGGARGDLDLFRRFVSWSRAQFEPGVPNPYPPIDARIILRDVRSGFTGGFCAQYDYLLVQALQSLGVKARYVSVVRHEVVEAFARDERRWICLDPLNGATYIDGEGRALSVLELHERERSGAPITAGPGSRPGAAEAVHGAFLRFSVWLKNDHVSRPVNFTDLPRYMVRYLDAGERAGPGDPLSTTEAADLYFDPGAP